MQFAEAVAVGIGLSQFVGPAIRRVATAVASHSIPMPSPRYDPRYNRFDETQMPDYFQYTRPRSLTSSLLKTTNILIDEKNSLGSLSLKDVGFGIGTFAANVWEDIINRITRPMNVITSSDIETTRGRWLAAASLAITDNIDYLLPIVVLGVDHLITKA